MSKTIYIGGRLESKEKGNVVTGANAILDDTKGKKQNVINKETDDELARLEQSKQDNLNFDSTPTEDSTNPVTSGGVYTAEKALSDAIEAILLLIPSAATALNKLVDTNTMNSSISTATATFRGTYNAVSDLGLTYQATHAQIEAALDALGLTADNNDFAFVQIPVSDQSQDIAKTERFKFNGTNWLYEYDLNTSGFTAAQWAAINSGITVALVTKLTDLPTAAALQLALNAKQDTLTFDNEPTALSQNPVTSGGIYTAIQAVATALSDYSTTTDGRLNVLEGFVPTEASSSNKLTDKAYVDGLIQAITELIPAEATTTNQLADKAFVLAQILAATPAFKGQFVTLAELQAVASPKAGDLGIVRTKDSDGMDVFTVYQYLNNAWNVFYSLSYHPQTKPATTGTTGDYPYNGMGRVELAKNMVNTGTELAPVMVNQLTQDMFYKGAVGSRVPNTNTIFVIRYDYVLGEDITIPDNCVLEFDGGSISGAYTITGNNTGIDAELVKIFNTDITLAGTWNVTEAYPEWFGAVGDGNTDDTIAIQKTLNFAGNIFFPSSTYALSSVSISSDSIISFSPKCHIVVSRALGAQEKMIVIGMTENITINGNGAIIDMKRQDYPELEEGEWRHGILISSSKNILIQDIVIQNTLGDGIDLESPSSTGVNNENIFIINCKCDNNRRQGISISDGKNIHIESCVLSNAHGAEYGPCAGIDIEPNNWAGHLLQDIFITNCISFGNTGYGILIAASLLASTDNEKYININVNNFVSKNDGGGVSLQNYTLHNCYGNIIFDNICVYGKNFLTVGQWGGNPNVITTFRGCKFVRTIPINDGRGYINNAIYFHPTGTYEHYIGDIFISDIYVSNITQYKIAAIVSFDSEYTADSDGTMLKNVMIKPINVDNGVIGEWPINGPVYADATFGSYNNVDIDFNVPMEVTDVDQYHSTHLRTYGLTGSGTIYLDDSSKFLGETIRFLIGKTMAGTTFAKKTNCRIFNESYQEVTALSIIDPSTVLSSGRLKCIGEFIELRANEKGWVISDMSPYMKSTLCSITLS